MIERYDFYNCFPKGHKSARLAQQLNCALNSVSGNEKTLNSSKNTMIYFCCYVRDSGVSLRNFRYLTEDIVKGCILLFLVTELTRTCRHTL